MDGGRKTIWKDRSKNIAREVIPRAISNSKYIDRSGFHSSDARQLFSLEIFEQCATTGRNITDFISISELVDGRHRIPATYQGKGSFFCSFSHRLSNSLCAMLELSHFKDTHRA